MFKLIVTMIIILLMILYHLYTPAENTPAENTPADSTSNDVDEIIQPLSTDENLEEDSLAHRVKNLTYEGLNNKPPPVSSPIPLLRFSQQLPTSDISNDECSHIEKNIDNYRENESQIGVEGSQESYLKFMNS